MNCEHCGKTFEAKRSDAKYCGHVCRSAAAKRTQLSAPRLSAPKILSDSENSLSAEEYCQYPGGPDCTCQHCQQARTNNSKITRNHGPHKTAKELGKATNRVSLPGDQDYVGVCNG